VIRGIPRSRGDLGTSGIQDDAAFGDRQHRMIFRGLRGFDLAESRSLDQLIDTTDGDHVCNLIRASTDASQSVAFVSGNFNVVHPGHLRLLKFAAEQADILVVGVNPDETPGVTLAQEMRLDNVRSISLVHHVVRLETSASDFIARLQPSIVVKGKEFEDRINPEQQAVDAYVEVFDEMARELTQ